MIYGIRHKITDRWYIGQTQHFVDANKGYFHRYPNGFVSEKFPLSPLLQNDVIKYGFNQFDELKVLSLGYSEQELNILEAFWIKDKNSLTNGYNTAFPNYRKHFDE